MISVRHWNDDAYRLPHSLEPELLRFVVTVALLRMFVRQFQRTELAKLPRVAQLYVSSVIAIGTLVFALCIRSARFDQPVLFVTLLLLSPIMAVLKVYLPVFGGSGGGSTLSASYGVDFASLLLVGPHETMLVAAGSAISQCHLNARQPRYRTVFSIACLVITVQTAGLKSPASAAATAVPPSSPGYQASTIAGKFSFAQLTAIAKSLRNDAAHKLGTAMSGSPE